MKRSKIYIGKEIEVVRVDNTVLGVTEISSVHLFVSGHGSDRQDAEQGLRAKGDRLCPCRYDVLVHVCDVSVSNFSASRFSLFENAYL